MKQAIKHLFQNLMHKYPLAFYFLIALVAFWPLSFGGLFLQYDALDVYLPWRFYGSESLRQGMVPLWNPYQDGGYPFYADHQYSIWNPELFLVSLFTRYNATIVVYLYLFYLAIGATGFRFLARQFNVLPNYAFLGGLVFMLSGTMVGHAQSVISILGMVWLPWALGAYIRALRSNFLLRDTLIAGLMLSLMLLAGYQAVSIMLFYVLLVLFFIFLLRSLKDKKHLLNFLFGHSLIGLILVLTLAGVFYSLLDVFPHLDRLSGLDLEATSRYSMHPKSLSSFILPFANAQAEYQGSILSAQNLFVGIPTLIAAVYGFKTYLKKRDIALNTLLIFAVIFGIAAFGSKSFIQPILAANLPGLDLFFYAVFYRYFTLLVLLLMACFGFQRIIEENKWKPFLVGISVFIAVYILCIIQFIPVDFDWKGVFFSNWALNFFGIGFQSAAYVESILHLVILSVLVAVVLLLRKKLSFAVLALCISLELIVGIQLNLPITVHGITTQAELNAYFETKDEGFPKPDPNAALSENRQDCYPYAMWRNQGNFTNKIVTDAWTSFHLSKRKEAYSKPIEEQRLLDQKGLFFTLKDNARLYINEFSPSKVNLTAKLAQGDTLCFQQAYYPGWEAKINGKKVKILLKNEYQMAIVLAAGVNRISFEFKKPYVVFLYWISTLSILFLALLLLFLFSEKKKLSLLFGLAFAVFVVVRMINMLPTRNKEARVQTESKNDLIHIPTSNSERRKLLIESPERIKIESTGAERDLFLQSLLNGLYSTQKQKMNGLTYSDRIFPVIGKTSGEFFAVESEILHSAKVGDYFSVNGFIHTEDTSNVFLVLEQFIGEKGVDYRAFNAKEALIMDSLAYFYVPFQFTGRDTKIYIWNRENKEIRKSAFAIKALSAK